MSPQPADVGTVPLIFASSYPLTASCFILSVYCREGQKEFYEFEMRLSLFIVVVVVTLQVLLLLCPASVCPMGEEKHVASRQTPAFKWPNPIGQGSVTYTEAIRTAHF